MRHLAGLGDSQLLTPPRCQIDPFSKMERTHHLFRKRSIHLSQHSTHAIFARSSSSLVSGPANCGKWTHRPDETLSSMRWQTYQTSTTHLQPLAGQDLRTQTRSCRQVSQSRGAPDVSAAVRINKHSGVRVSRKKQFFPSLPHAIILSVCCTTTRTFTVLCPALFFFRFCVLTHTRSMAAAHDKRTDDWASPEHFHRYATKIRAEIQREKSRESRRPTENAKDEEARIVLLRGSVIQQNMTKLASIAT